MTAIIINTKLRLTSKEQTPSIWLEGGKLRNGGIESGNILYAQFDKTRKRVVASATALEGTNDVKAFTVSRRRRRGKEYPLIELRSDQLAELFGNSETLRVSISEGRIIIRAHSQGKNEEARLERFLDKIRSGKKLNVGALFHGGGVADRSLHEGFSLSGISSAIKVAVEIEGKYLESSLLNNPMLWDKDSIAIESPLEQVELNNTPALEIIVAGIPCVGASLAGRTKGKLTCGEEHSTAGALFVYFLRFVLATQPAMVIFENVPPYLTSASYYVIDSVLRSSGYEVNTMVMNGNEFGALENRDRLVCVATTKGLSFDFTEVKPTRVKEDTLSEILDSVPQESKQWKSYSYLADKEERDIAAGKGFKRQLLDGTESKCGVVGRGYNKVRSTEPQIVSPFEKGMSRLLTPAEHARVKGIPEGLIEGLSDTVAHEILGQSVIYPLFVALGKSIMEQMSRQASVGSDLAA